MIISKTQLSRNDSRAGRNNACTFFLLFCFILAILSTPVLVQGLQTYPEVSGLNNTWLLGTSVINDDTDLTRTASLVQIQTPLVDDLNNDGVNEIIVIDLNSGFSTAELQIFQGSSLAPIDSIHMNATANTNDISNLAIADLDGDNMKEIYYIHNDYSASPDTWLQRITFNSSNDLNIEFLDSADLTSTSATDSYIGCNSDGNCLYLSTRQDFANYFIHASAFNSTGLSVVDGTITVHNDASDNDGACLPDIKYIPSADIDNDGTEEFVISWMEVDDGVTLNIEVIEINPSNTSDIILQASDSRAVGSWRNDPSVDCHPEYSNWITLPYVADIDGFTANGLEIVVGIKTALNTFKMYSFDKDLNFLDDYPEVGSSIGYELSNIFKASALATTGDDDFCMLGFNRPDAQFLCGSERNRVRLSESVEYDYVSTPGNMTITQNNANLLIHGVSHQDSTTGYTALLSPYGIYQINTDDEEINRLYELVSLGSTISADVENTGFEDIIVVSDANLWYFNDAFTNSNCRDQGCINSVYFNPCIEGTIRQNETLEIRVQVEDQDADPVQLKISVYDGSLAEQNVTWSQNYSSGATVPFTFQLINRTNNGVITIQARDANNLNLIQNLTFPLSVGFAGLRYNDATCTEDFEIIPPNVTEATQSEVVNVVDTSWSDIRGEFGLSGLAAFYLMLIFGVGFIIFEGFKQKWDGRITLAVASLSAGAWYIFGIAFALIPWTHFVGYLMIMVGSIGITLRTQAIGAG